MKNLYSVLDTRVNSFSSPFVASGHPEAERMISEALHGESLLSKYPEDFRLFHVGTWDPDRGEVAPTLPCLVTDLSALVVKASS